MKLSYLLIIAMFALLSCKPKPTLVVTRDNLKPVRVLPASYKATTGIKASSADTSEMNAHLNAFANYYVLVADTGKDYDDLKAKMLALHESSNLAIDTMGRYYDKTKGLIDLPDDDDDEMDTGEYFPRRYPSESLSLEYLDEYRPASKSKMIALIVGIYETKTSADSALNAIKPGKNAFVQKARIYVGCMY